MPTHSVEDYLERMYNLINEKGYARVSDIADALEIQPPSVTHMLQRLDEEGYVEYEKYRGVTLTEKGEAVGRDIAERHRDLTTLLELLGVEDDELIFRDVEGIEHYLSPESMERIRALVDFAREHPGWWDEFRAGRSVSGKDASSPDA